MQHLCQSVGPCKTCQREKISCLRHERNITSAFLAISLWTLALQSTRNHDDTLPANEPSPHCVQIAEHLWGRFPDKDMAMALTTVTATVIEKYNPRIDRNPWDFSLLRRNPFVMADFAL